MKRMHVHVAVEDLGQSIRFYSTMFATGPTVMKADYAKWMLDDPRVNFAISTHSGRAPGIDHLGIQVEDGSELQEVYGRLKQAEGPVLEEGKTTCCYAQSEKSWIADPQGVPWEAFLTIGESTVYGQRGPRVGPTAGNAVGAATACCGPTTEVLPKAREEKSACCGSSAAL